MAETITGVILAGGQARRLENADKAFVSLGSKPLIHHVLARFQNQCDATIINANGDPHRFADLHLPIAADTIDDFPGPLAGILAAMEWAQANRPDDKWVASLPVDTPFVPVDMVAKMIKAIGTDKAQLACASSNNRNHPVIGIWPIELANDLREAITNEKIRKVDLWTARYKLSSVEFDTDPVDPFFNINRPKDIQKAEHILVNLK